jgi:hypothetical protein
MRISARLGRLPPGSPERHAEIKRRIFEEAAARPVPERYTAPPRDVAEMLERSRRDQERSARQLRARHAFVANNADRIGWQEDLKALHDLGDPLLDDVATAVSATEAHPDLQRPVPAGTEISDALGSAIKGWWQRRDDASLSVVRTLVGMELTAP